MKNRDEVTSLLMSRVIENAPIKELIRVYSESLQAALSNLSDEELVRSIQLAGHTDILEHFGEEVPALAEPEEIPATNP